MQLIRSEGRLRIGGTLWHASSLPSTNSTLRELVGHEVAGHGAAVWADEQTAGRGRLSRSWSSPPGAGLFVSVFIARAEPRLLPCIAALAVRGAIRELLHVDSELKWPNDVLVSGKKVAGILVEQLPEGAIVGIGINTNMTRTHLDRIGPEAGSLVLATGSAIGHDALIERVFECLETEYIRSQQDPSSLFTSWKDALVTLGQTVEVETSRETWVGKAVDVAVDGSLLVLNDKRLVQVYAADVRIRPR